MTLSIDISVLLFLIYPICTAQQYQAIAHINNDIITGTIVFTEIVEGLHVNGIIQGLSKGYYGFHIHEIGDPSNNCLAAGAHFNPEGVNHGGRDNKERHVGDYGNIEFGENDVAIIDFIDTVSSLSGKYSILGRTVILHEREDDLGLGNHEDSLTTGNAGSRIACGVIGLLAPVEPWRSF